ncbi:signal receiver domain-containing protein [Halosimplex carlsbadense 2-9-1]|uniref:Signal receiver domain-containing protein n=1 Tax=Halosimplex carlsbadense 2-9-1 TaxID=797114 RepID=M0CDF4_9EURY|nr:response regulator [Halosimplex carlsbadense]ELZ20663.1 signal receiver domain-containing protein [Halosimplex carlsbadense 2-9-1]
MSSSPDGRPTVLVVDDETEVADVLALKIRERYETRVAYGGREALESMDETVDAVLLDRRMPDVHGDDVLAEIRDRGHDCVVVMTTAVDPELNILEMDFDDYLSKPIETETLLSTLDTQLDSRQSGDPKLEEFFSVVSKLEVLESELTPAELADSDEYEHRKREAEELGRELQETHPDFDEIVDTFRDIGRN